MTGADGASASVAIETIATAGTGTGGLFFHILSYLQYSEFFDRNYVCFWGVGGGESLFIFGGYRYRISNILFA